MQMCAREFSGEFAQAWWQPISVITCACAHVVEFTNVRGTNHRVPRAQDNSAVSWKFQNSANVVTSRHVATNVQEIQRWTFCPSEVTNGYITIQRWIFSVRKLIFWQASSKITLVFPSPKTNLLSDLQKITFSRRSSAVNFDFRCLSRVCSAILQMTQILLWHFLVLYRQEEIISQSFQNYVMLPAFHLKSYLWLYIFFFLRI